jgi:hypothetical protein
MSTSFEVKRPEYSITEPEDSDEYLEDAYVKVAHQDGGGAYWTNKLAPLLPDNMPVYVWDNFHPPEIQTIGDLRHLIDGV